MNLAFSRSTEMRYLKFFWLSFIAMPAIGQVGEIYTIKVLGKDWQLNGFNVQYQLFVPKMIDSAMTSQEVMHLLYDGGHSGKTPEVFQNMEPMSIYSEQVYVPFQPRQGVNISAIFKRSTNTIFLRRQELRAGLQFNSATMSAILIIDTLAHRHHFYPIRKDLSFDAAYFLNTRPLKRWAFYTGLGSNIGFSVQNKFFGLSERNGDRSYPNRNLEDKVYTSFAKNNLEVVFRSRPSFVCSCYSLVGAKFNLDCEFNFFFEATYGYSLRKYGGVQLLTNSYWGINMGVRYKVFAEKQAVKNSDKPFW